MATTKIFLTTVLNPQVPPPPSPPTEATLRQQAITTLQTNLSASPNGTGSLPPPFYHPDHFAAPRRPSQYIKDWDTGRIRPRRLMDDLVANNQNKTRVSKETPHHQKTHLETPASKEKRLRAAAIRQMTQRLANKPNGTGILPPPFYRRDRVDHPDRPMAWIKDWDDGKVRPRIMMDDFREVEMEGVEVKREAGVDSDEGYYSGSMVVL